MCFKVALMHTLQRCLAMQLEYMAAGGFQLLILRSGSHASPIVRQQVELEKWLPGYIMHRHVHAVASADSVTGHWFHMD
jgi:hypothetical protein